MNQTHKQSQAISVVFGLAIEQRITVAELHILMLGLNADPETIALARKRIEEEEGAA